MKEVSTPLKLLLTNFRLNYRNEELFNYKERTATREDFMSLKIDSKVHIAIIDVWACILNKEQLLLQGVVDPSSLAAFQCIEVELCRLEA